MTEMNDQTDLDSQIKKHHDSRERLTKAEESIAQIQTECWKLRALVEENHHHLIANYIAAFTGNRQLAIQNNDDIFRQRINILTHMESEDPALELLEHHFESKADEALVDNLEFRAKLSDSVVAMCESFKRVNDELDAITDRLLAVNQDIVDFNTQNIQKNRELIENHKAAIHSTPEENDRRIQQSMARLQELEKRFEETRNRTRTLSAQAQADHQKIGKEREQIRLREQAILNNRAQLEALCPRLHEMISPNED